MSLLVFNPNTFIISPYIAAYGAVILHTFLLFYYIWIPENYLPQNNFQGVLYRAMKVLFRTFYGVFGFLFLEIAFFWLMGSWGYNDWAFQLPSVIIALICGIEYFIGAWLVTPKKTTIISGICILGATIWYVHGYIVSLSRIYHNVYYVFIIPIIATIILWIAGIMGQFIFKKDIFNAPELWNKHSFFCRIFSKRVNIIIWLFVLIEAMLKFYGTSLFLW